MPPSIYPSENELASALREDSATLTLEIPSAEEIAKTIWQRQHDVLNPDAFTYRLEWRDDSIPSKYWDEFLLDAEAVLTLLTRKHIEYHNASVVSP